MFALYTHSYSLCKSDGKGFEYTDLVDWMPVNTFAIRHNNKSRAFDLGKYFYIFILIINV